MKTLTLSRICALMLLVAGATTARAVSYNLATDVPPTLGGSDYQTGQVLRADDSSYLVADSLQPDLDIGALHRRGDGSWLFVPVDPTTLGGAEYDSRDVVRYDGSTYSLFFDGEAAGIPAEARIDAVLEQATGLVLSLDEPAALDGTFYDVADLMAHDGTGFAPYFDGGGAGVELGVNLVGASIDDLGTLVLTFEDPLELGGTLYRPGDLISWDGSGFALYFADPGWDLTAYAEGLHVLDSFGSGDSDGDRFASGIDCDDTDPGVWSVPGEAGGLVFASDKNSLSWDAPVSPGGDLATVTHAVQRADQPDDFSASVCLAAVGGTSAFDVDTPASGDVFYYVAGAANSCGQGSLGQSSDGLGRVGGVCP